MTGCDDARHWFSSGVGECMNAMYRVALRLTRNPADAEDLVAETVSRAWAAIDTLADRSRFRPWLFRILHNGFVSDYRSRRAQPARVSIDEDGDDDVASLLNAQPDAFLKWWASPEQAVVNKVLGEQIVAAIDALPDAFRETIVLVNVEGLGYDEAAEVLGVPPGTVRSRMKRGRTLLQKALWQHAVDAGLIGGADEDR